MIKENTRPHDFKLHTEQRAIKRAMFNYSVTILFDVIFEPVWNNYYMEAFIRPLPYLKLN